MITQQLKKLTEAVAQSFPDAAVAIIFQSWVHTSGARELSIRLPVLLGVGGEDCTAIHFRDEAELTEWINNGCDTSVVYLDEDGIYLRVPELRSEV